MANNTIDNSLCTGRIVNFDVSGPNGIEHETGIFLAWVIYNDEDYGEIPHALIETALGLVEMVSYLSIQFPSPLLDSFITADELINRPGDTKGKEEES